MFLRKQTLYLIVALISSGLLPFWAPLGYDSQGKSFYFYHFWASTYGFGASALLSFIAINTYKKRPLQSVFCRFTIVLNLILLGVLYYYSTRVSGGIDLPVKGIGLGLPLLSIVALVLANSAIKKDEKLVKSSNRIR
jgi:hypothetical protein